MEHFDFIIIGAGASGIAAGYNLQKRLPGSSFIMLETRDRIGGTWDIFRFPGIRSDSYLTAFGFQWRPWHDEKEIAPAAKIQQYLEDSAASEGLDKKIRFRHRAYEADWSSSDKRWTVKVDVDGETKVFTTNFLLACSGYYDYSKPLQANIPGIDDFKGRIAHPQFWPKDLTDFTGKSVAIIGSGATAITLLPEVAKTADKVTLVQRSPNFVLAIPSRPAHMIFLRTWLPTSVADKINFWFDIIVQALLQKLCSWFPEFAKGVVIKRMAKELPPHIPVDPHFTPKHRLWEQRVGICPDGDFFEALRGGKCEVVTDTIDTVTESSIIMKGGQKVDADIIVTATGLRLDILGDLKPTVDGQTFNVAERYGWRGFMLEGVPNFALILGYTTVAWPVGSDICMRIIVKVVKHMREIGASSVRPEVENRDKLKSEPIIGMNSTYFVVAHDRMPRGAGVEPWQERGPFLREWIMTRLGSFSWLAKGLVFDTDGGGGGRAAAAATMSKKKIS